MCLVVFSKDSISVIDLQRKSVWESVLPKGCFEIGGEIAISSRMNLGTTITITLPLRPFIAVKQTTPGLATS